jgi:DnaJ-class molecular chaperone
MYDQKHANRIQKQQESLKKRVAELRGRIDQGREEGFEKLLLQNMDAYFHLEEKCEEIDLVLSNLPGEIEETVELTGFQKLGERLDYLEDIFEEVAGEALERTQRRRRRRFNFADFFRSSQGGQVSPNDISSSQEAYKILGLDTGCSMAKVTAAFRKLAKQLHPDARGGDRSQEPQLRKLVAAYQFIKDEGLE